MKVFQQILHLFREIKKRKKTDDAGDAKLFNLYYE